LSDQSNTAREYTDAKLGLATRKACDLHGKPSIYLNIEVAGAQIDPTIPKLRVTGSIQMGDDETGAGLGTVRGSTSRLISMNTQCTSGLRP
jgi:hypothetical protein